MDSVLRLSMIICSLFVTVTSLSKSYSLKYESELSSDEKILVCYYRDHIIEDSLLPSNVCTHIIFAFGILTPDGIIPETLTDPKSYRALVKLKEKNPKLKVMISLQKGFPTVVSHGTEAMLKFSLSTLSLLNNYNMDGVDLDWEFPFLLEKKAYSDFIMILSNVLHWSGKILSLALPNDIGLFERGYFPDTLNTHADFMTVMTYDFHYYSVDRDNITGFNSPLYSAKGENPFASTAGLLDYLLFRGLSSNKLLIGFPTYGRTWTLANASVHGLHSPALGVGAPGPVTHLKGYYMIQDVCASEKKAATVVKDTVEGGEYMYNSTTWVAFNGMYSASIKVEWLKRKNLAGVGVWTFEDDDPHNICGNGPFPILSKLRSLLEKK